MSESDHSMLTESLMAARGLAHFDWGRANNPLLNTISMRRMDHIPDNVILHDTTLRDGEQTPSVAFSKEEKIAIAKALSEYGIHRIEIMPAVSQDDFEATSELNAMGLDAEIVGFCRCVKADIDKAIDAGCKAIVMELAANPNLLKAFDWSMEKATGMMIENANYAKSKGLRVTAFFVAVTDSPPEFIREFLKTVCAGADVDAIALPDTFGKLMPGAFYDLVLNVKAWTEKPVEVHPHNLFGLGVANALYGVMAGAEVVHGCVNSLGEGAGNADIEGVAVALKLMMGMDTGVDFKKTPELSKLVADIARIPLQPNWPINGERVFSTEAGIAVDIYDKMDKAGVTLPAELDIAANLGREHGVVIGKLSGRKSIELKMQQLGLPEATSDQLKEILEKVKDKAIEIHFSLNDEQFKEIVTEVCG